MSLPKLPVPVGSVRRHDDVGASRASVVDAQLLGQDGRKRGLRGGPPVLRAARSAYLEAEYSGAGERRVRVGVVAAKKV